MNTTNIIFFLVLVGLIIYSLWWDYEQLRKVRKETRRIQRQIEEDNNK